MSSRPGVTVLGTVTWVLMWTSWYSQASQESFPLADDQCRGCPDGSCHDPDGQYKCIGDCKSGYFGRSCQHLCPSRCKDGTCDKMLGTCAGCLYGFHGPRCSLQCSSHCNTRDHQKCYQETGSCIGACLLGYYGQSCDKACPEHCNLSCNRNDGSCFVCDSRYWGQFCNNTCAPNCFLACDQLTGRCPVCNSGWRGVTCQSTCSLTNCKSCTTNDECSACKEGWYGLKCDKSCSQYCQSSTCDRRTGNCDCQNGWFGEQCNNPCIPNCSLCSSNRTCVLCEDGFYGANCEHKCIDGCKTCLRSGLQCTDCKDEDRYGDKCECSFSECAEREKGKFDCILCSEDDWFPFENGCCPCTSGHCLDSAACNSHSAACSSGCQRGYYGIMCTNKCSPFCTGGNTSCHGNLGHCANGCSADWFGRKCDASFCTESYPHCIQCAYRQKPYSVSRNDLDCTECEPGYYITNGHCEECLHCKDNKCRSHDGICLEGCARGWFLDTFREYCTNECGRCVNHICHAFNGTCVNGCQPGYYDHTCTVHCPRNCQYATCNSSGICAEGCNHGFYGLYCYDQCERCLQDVCDRETGVCLKCKPQWHGPECSQSCDGCVEGMCTDGQGCADGCWPGLYGISCNMTCPDKSSCYACDQMSGQCIVCKDTLGSPAPPSCKVVMDDVTWTEAYRETSCAPGYYGEFCKMQCSEKCLVDSEKRHCCDRFTGTCLPIAGCYPGNYGLYCDRICINCLYGACTRDAGMCLHGCATGWSGPECVAKIETVETVDISLLFTTVAVLGATGVGLLMVLLCYICCTTRKDPKAEVYIPTDPPGHTTL
ncbi:Cell death abnormality protein 1 [Mizuhopecten yessoensis]|uniref:Cell death abnormality protein 1 n=2 Tax=Mizuhopecten yessoensis TaxID=6573 RepID=A0A210PYE9_MIZYE|nr:Cell death abnormality protein 1 [Mizuhopecten yessoensis]